MDFAYAVAIAVISFLGGYFSAGLRSYTNKKGENLATKEDLRELTEIVENVKDGNARALAKLTEEMRAHNSMRSAALEKRLEVHQDAYRLSTRMFQTVFADDGQHRDMGDELREWWMRNSLYLDEKPREAFDKAWVAFIRHPTLMAPGTRVEADLVIKNFDYIRDLPKVLEASVSLPPIKLDPLKQLEVEVPAVLAEKGGD